MHIFISGLLLLVSFYILAKIVDGIFIKSLDNIADFLKLPPDVAGATLLAVGTSTPELMTALLAIFLTGVNPSTGLGTIVGSAIFQILVVIGFAAIIKTSYLNWKPVIRDGIFYALSVLLLLLIIKDGVITFGESTLLVLGYFVYLAILLLWIKFIHTDDDSPIEIVENDKKTTENKSFLYNVLKMATFPIDFIISLIPDPKKYKNWTIPTFIISLLGIGLASYLLVNAGESFALGIGVPSSVVALTILAGGTSIPELISSVIVSRQGRGDMAISNAIGSNSFDILISLGLPLSIYTGVHGPLGGIGSENINSSIILLFVTMLMVLLLLISQKFHIGKVFGGVLIATYVIYAAAAYLGLL